MAKRKGAPWFPQISKADALIFGGALLLPILGGLYMNWRMRKTFEQIGTPPPPPEDEGEESEMF